MSTVWTWASWLSLPLLTVTRFEPVTPCARVRMLLTLPLSRRFSWAFWEARQTLFVSPTERRKIRGGEKKPGNEQRVVPELRQIVSPWSLKTLRIPGLRSLSKEKNLEPV